MSGDRHDSARSTRIGAFWQANRSAATGVLAALVLGVLAALVVSLLQATRFSASTSVSLRPMVADVDVAEAADRLAANLSVWATSEDFAKRLTPDEIAGLSPGQVAAKARARAVLKEMRVVVEFEDSTADRAASVVNGLARVVVEEARRSLSAAPADKSVEIEQMDKAKPPDKPVWPRLEVALPAGGLMGLAFGLVAAALAGWLAQPVRTPETAHDVAQGSRAQR